MKTLRKTQQATALRQRDGKGSLGVVLPTRLMLAGLLLMVMGCGGQPTPEQGAAPSQEPATDGNLLTKLPPPATDRIEYDSQTRTLTFYDLPQSSRWMVHRSDALMPDAVGPDHRLPEGLDPDNTFVYYRRPGGQQSRAVTLAEIQAAREQHSSH